MDLQNIGELHCSICFELFGENFRCPRVLICGHSFCHSCLENLLVQSPSCPNCKHEIKFTNVDCIPVNYNIKSLASRSNVNDSLSLNELSSALNSSVKGDLKEDSKDILPPKKESSSLELPYEGYCEDHHINKHLRCMDCKCWVCGLCVALSHKPCRTLLVAVALEEMKNEISQEVKVEIGKQKSKCLGIDKHLKDLKKKKLSLEKELASVDQNIENLQLLKSESEENCERVKLLESSVITSANDEQFINATSKLNEFLDQSRKLLGNLTLPNLYCSDLLTIEALKDFCHEKSVYALHCENGSNLYGKVDVKGDRVWIQCFVSQEPRSEDVVIPLSELLLSFGGSSEFPRRGFLQFSELLLSFGMSSEFPRRGFLQIDDGRSGVSDVIIATDALTPRAMNFLLLCSGIKGRSYEGERLSDFGWSIGTPSNGEAVVEGIIDGGPYEAPMKKGFVWGRWAEVTNSLSGFFIRMKDEPKRKLPTKFGFVEEGIEICEIIYRNKNGVFIKSCGLVI